MKQAFPGAQMAAQYVFFLEVEGGIYIYIYNILVGLSINWEFHDPN